MMAWLFGALLALLLVLAAHGSADGFTGTRVDSVIGITLGEAGEAHK